MTDCNYCTYRGICKHKEKFLQYKEEIENNFGKEVFWSIECKYYVCSLNTSTSTSVTSSWGNI